MENLPIPGRTYLHYKGEKYLVDDIVINKSDNPIPNKMVLYHNINRPTVMFVRDIKEWDSEIEIKGTKVKRYKLLYHPSEM